MFPSVYSAQIQHQRVFCPKTAAVQMVTMITTLWHNVRSVSLLALIVRRVAVSAALLELMVYVSHLPASVQQDITLCYLALTIVEVFYFI